MGALSSYLRGGNEFRLAPRFWLRQNPCTRLTARPAVRGPGQCAASLLASRIPFVTITPDGCDESRILHIAFPFCGAKWEPFHLTCAAEMNSALRQNACTRLTARPAVRGPGQCAVSLLVSRIPFVTITPDGCYESRILHIAFPFCGAKWEPFHLTCAAEVNSALRQGFGSAKTLVRA